MLEKLETPCRLQALDQTAGKHREPALLAMIPLGKGSAPIDATSEQAAADGAGGRGPAPHRCGPYGEFDTVLDTLMPDIGPGHLITDRCSIADVLRGTALAWAAQATIVPEHPEIMNGIGRFQVRPAAQRRRERDEAPLVAR